MRSVYNEIYKIKLNVKLKDSFILPAIPFSPMSYWFDHKASCT